MPSHLQQRQMQPQRLPRHPLPHKPLGNGHGGTIIGETETFDVRVCGYSGFTGPGRGWGLNDDRGGGCGAGRGGWGEGAHFAGPRADEQEWKW